MAKKIVAKVKRKPKHFYYVDGNGNVYERTITRRKKKRSR